MATPWKSATAYSPGSIVSYNGLDYVRSQYPNTATSGTPPNEEMSVDTFGVDIRTWTILVSEYDFYAPTFQTNYFRLIQPTYNSTDINPDFQYSGPQFSKSNAYSAIGDIDSPPYSTYGLTYEMDQAKDNPSPTPDSPVCPAEKCGLAMQQLLDDNGQIFCFAYSRAIVGTPRNFRVFVRFNHPLYFRRTITVLVRIRKETIAPDETTITYLNSYNDFIPSDRNYTELITNADYDVADNAVFVVIVPENEARPDGTDINYSLVLVEVVDVSPNF